jgi:hypothetical protein
MVVAASRRATKCCPGCGRQLDRASFGGNRCRADGLQSQCKDCKRLSQSKWYRGNGERHRQNVVRRRDATRRENVSRLLAYLLGHPCADCGEADPLVLQFDHVRGDKTKDVALLLAQGYSWEAVSREMAKCEVRCANCHQRKTAREQGWRKALCR